MTGFFPSSPTGRAPGSPVGPSDRDGNWNGYSIEKLQYQKNFDSHSYLRALVWGAYSDWFINGPHSAQLVFGSDPADYEVLEHGYGATSIYANQLSTQHLLTAEASYMTQRLQTYNAGFSLDRSIHLESCAHRPGNDSLQLRHAQRQVLQLQDGSAVELFRRRKPGRVLDAVRMLPRRRNVPLQLDARVAPTSTPAARAGARWMMTENGQSAQVDDVTPHFGSAAITDLWQPNDRIVVNIGARFDRFAYEPTISRLAIRRVSSGSTPTTTSIAALPAKRRSGRGISRRASSAPARRVSNR